MVSVIIPAYNCGKSTINAVKSVVMQTFTNWEIIIIDDGSGDDTFSIIAVFLQSLLLEGKNKIILHKQINQGPSSARNQGIMLSQGEYIAFLDSDDEWEKSKLEVQMNYFKNDPNLFFCGTAFEKKKFKENLKYKYITFDELIFRNYFSTPTVIVKAKVFKKYDFDIRQKYSEDYKLWLQIAYDYKCIYINTVLANNQFKKLEYGDTGLSSNLWEMEKGELSNYLFLFKLKKIRLHKLVICSLNSLLKYIFRVMKTKMNKITS